MLENLLAQQIESLTRHIASDFNQENLAGSAPKPIIFTPGQKIVFGFMQNPSAPIIEAASPVRLSVQMLGRPIPSVGQPGWSVPVTEQMWEQDRKLALLKIINGKYPEPVSSAVKSSLLASFRSEQTGFMLPILSILKKQGPQFLPADAFEAKQLDLSQILIRQFIPA